MGNCAKCGKAYKENEKFCGKCGSRIPSAAVHSSEISITASVCYKCGTLLRENARFCSKCGFQVTTSEVANNQEDKNITQSITTTEPVLNKQLEDNKTLPGVNEIAAAVQEIDNKQPTINTEPIEQQNTNIENVNIKFDTSNNNYSVLATQKTPAFIIYLLDISGSMNRPLGNKRKIDIVHDALSATIRQMVFRSTKGGRISPRYRLAIYAYSNCVYDLLGGIVSVDEVAQLKIPELNPESLTYTAKAFTTAEELLEKEIPNLRNCPAPLVCHMTDGEYNGSDPTPIVERIMKMEVPDGRVLVENIFISNSILKEPIADSYAWSGITHTTELNYKYANQLKSMSSPIPESYRSMMKESNYHLQEGALMLLPGSTPDLITLGFQMSAATPIR